MEILKYLYFTLVIGGILFILIFVTNYTDGDCYLCDNRRELYRPEIKAKFIKIIEEKYFSKMLDFCYYESNEVLYKHVSASFYKLLKVGDSIYKPANSVMFYVYRNKKLIVSHDEDWGCNYTIIDSLKNKKPTISFSKTCRNWLGL